MKTAVLIHGYHRDAEGWEDIIWGQPREQKLGRVPKGILEALKCDASIIIFGSGLHYADGVIESRAIFQYALAHLAELSALTGMAPEALGAWLTARAVFDEVSTNTQEESRHALESAHESGADEFIFVSSPWHIMRCMRSAITASDSSAELSRLRQHLYATAADTSIPGLTAEDVLIFEPPHRPEIHHVPLDKTLAGILPFLRTSKEDVAAGFNDALAALIRSWADKL